MDEKPKCKDCGQLMVEVPNFFGRNIQWDDGRGNGGLRCQKLYQCPEDKTVAVV